MAPYRGTFDKLRVDLDPRDPHDRQYAMQEYHSRNDRLEVVARTRKSCTCPQNPTIHATYCDGCRKGKPGHFDRKALQAEAASLQKDVGELQCFLQGLKSK